MSGIYYMNDDNTLTELEEHPYDSEDILQQIISNYPELLSGVREMGIMDLQTDEKYCEPAMKN